MPSQKHTRSFLAQQLTVVVLLGERDVVAVSHVAVSHVVVALLTVAASTTRNITRNIIAALRSTERVARASVAALL